MLARREYEDAREKSNKYCAEVDRQCRERQDKVIQRQAESLQYRVDMQEKIDVLEARAEANEQAQDTKADQNK